MSAHHHHECASCASKGKNDFNPKNEIIISCICLAVFIIALIFSKNMTKITSCIVFTVIYGVTGWNVLKKAFNNIKNGGFFDEYFLMTIATLGAFAIQAFEEAAAVMLFFKIGNYLQELAVYKSRKSIKALLELRPDNANVIQNNTIVSMSPEKVEINSLILVKPGEKIPLDGIIIDGTSQIDTSAITGESVPKILRVKDTVLAGMINLTGSIHVKVTKHFSESSISKILELVENAANKKAKTELFFSVFARYYTPIIVAISLLTAILPPLFINDATFSQWIYRALVILVISCPCALVVSIPLTYFGGIGGASRRGILIKGSSYLDALNKVKTVVFDKTGTLTKGNFELIKINEDKNFDSKNYNNATLLQIVAEAEASSNHPIASSILRAYDQEVDFTIIKDYYEIAGKGISANIRGLNVLAGNSNLMKSYNIDFHAIDEVGTIVYVAINNLYVGYLIISDELKPDTSSAIQMLRNLGIKSIQMLTGDNTKIAENIAQTIGLDSFYAELLPEEKVNMLQNISSNNSKNDKVIYVGDGINDAPVLALADVGISMGKLGTDAAIETSDVVIMNDSLTKIPSLLKISKKTRNIIIQNICFALTVKLLFLILGFFGIATMWEAVFADVGVTVIAVFNATRNLSVKK